MEMSIISLIALLIVIVLAAFLKRNIGLLGLIFAFICSAIGGMGTGFFSGFPTNIVMILIGTGYLFGIANNNGTMENIARFFLRLARGRVALLPFVFGILGGVLAAIGASSFTMALMILPVAMSIAEKKKVNPFMMAVVVLVLIVMGDYSPIASFGLFIEAYFAEVGVTGIAGHVFATTVVTYLIVSAVVYVLFGGLKLWKHADSAGTSDVSEEGGILDINRPIAFDKNQKITLAGILVFVVAILLLPDLHTGLIALTVGVLISLCGCANEEEVIKNLPWDIILLISGVTLLVTVVQQAGGMEILVNAVASVSNTTTLTPMYSIIACFIAMFTSNMGVVFPTFMPMTMPLVEAVGGVDVINMTDFLTTFAVSTCLPDVSPISTMGAIALAAVSGSVDKSKLFRQMLTFAAIMVIVAPFITLLISAILP